ncbi:DUF3995 domain-containing protein [Segetibacter sp. 3557_3]|uniref:DUF3995 domain-containing protein n=1 Tax=Segetibacter sp. 3557_3 TaxID=2547429 RepID=UPI001058DD51|nr:DUF3995 domain-containing protein [Segetibacter sp. 3557_3]TDH28580.1 DUF3995 domain-containing protein [Segetibacter sp. 3557_3]
MNNNQLNRRIFIPVIINTAIFALLSLLHFYWAFGGTFWYDEVLPTNSSGSKKLNPGMTTGIIVASGLAVLAFISVGNLGWFHKHIKTKYFQYGALIIAGIFILRAIGDFRFFGFFKTIKVTKFAVNDTLFFSPLCVFIAVISLNIFFLARNDESGKKGR